MEYYDPADYTTVHNKHLKRLRIDASSDELARLRLVEAAARELINVPALRQALGDNHVGGCCCALCRLRSTLSTTI